MSITVNIKTYHRTTEFFKIVGVSRSILLRPKTKKLTLKGGDTYSEEHITQTGRGKTNKTN